MEVLEGESATSKPKYLYRWKSFRIKGIKDNSNKMK